MKVSLKLLTAVSATVFVLLNFATSPSEAADKETTASSKAAAHAPKDEQTPNAEESLKKLVDGNERFVKHTFRTDGAADIDIHRLATGQHPYAVVLSCSDSRVPTEVIFDQKLGEVFVIRTAGEALDSSVIGSIEYAIAHLGSHLVVVMGHTSCGAITAASNQLRDHKRADSPALEDVLHDIEFRISAFKDHPTSHFAKEAAANAEGVVQDLLFRSQLLREKAVHGDFKIVSAVYDIDSGKVAFNELEDLAKKTSNDMKSAIKK